ncbi:hypothetical protein BJX62DRAFT_248896 [Aspergillus germanicus]
MPERTAIMSVYHIHPLRWENDPEEERFKVTALDYLSVQTYNNYALFFRLADEDKHDAAEVLKAGLERTLSQARHLCGIIEKDTAGGHSFCKKRDSTVQFVKANFVRGGLFFIMHHHHYSNDVMGWAGLTYQLAENCYATKSEPPEAAKADGPPAPERPPEQRTGISLLFHLPKSKAPELKALATPEDGTWVSTYDAFSAFIFPHLTQLRAHIFKPAFPWPLWKLAAYIRALTNSVTQENLDVMVDMVAIVRDKSTLNIRIDAQPPMSILQTDHRDANITVADFGFGAPVTYRHLLDRVTNGVVIIYPPRVTAKDSDEGREFAIFYKKDLAQTLVDDPEWNDYFEYRGEDAIDATATRSRQT